VAALDVSKKPPKKPPTVLELELPSLSEAGKSVFFLNLSSKHQNH
jgi:hypothetical protein